MIANFFIWCAGTDKSILSKCSDAERTKHIGYGTLVVIPALLAFISMSYAISTLDIVANDKIIIYSIGAIWGFVIFSFDRFIVSTHRRKISNFGELKNPSFFLRFIFALVLGISVSHPLVLLWFDGSTTQQIIEDRDKIITDEENYFLKSSKEINSELIALNEKKACWQKILSAEQAGTKLTLPCGSSSGIPTFGKRAEEIKLIIKDVDKQIQAEKTIAYSKIENLRKLTNTKVKNLNDHLSFDYLKRELTLGKIMAEHKIVWITQIMIMLLFILVDLLPMIFKTFAPFGMYDKILFDDSDLLKQMDTSSRSIVLQKAYSEISGIYAEKKDIDKNPEDLRQKILNRLRKEKLQKDLLIGLFFGVVVIFFFILKENYGTESDESFNNIFWFSSFLFPLIISIIGGFIVELYKKITVKV